MTVRRPDAERAGVERLTRLLATLAALTTVPGLIGWMARIPWLVQPSHAFGPVRPWSLLLILTASVGVLALGLRRARLARTAAVAAMAIAAFGVVANSTGWAMALDSVLHTRLPMVEPLRPAFGVALTTGSLFIALAIATWLSARPQTTTALSLGISAVGAVVMTVAGVLWMSQLAGLLDSTAAREWVQAPIPSLAAAMLLGLAMLQRATANRRLSLAPPRWAPALVGIGGALIVLVLWRELSQRETAQRRDRARITADAAQAAVARQFGAVRNAVGRLSLFVASTPTRDAVLDRALPRLVAETDGLGRLLLMGVDGNVLHVVPASSQGTVSSGLREAVRAALAAVHSPREASATTAGGAPSSVELRDVITGLDDGPWGIAIIHPIASGPEGVAAVVALVDERELLLPFLADTGAGFAMRAFVRDSQIVGVPRAAATPELTRVLAFGSRMITLTLTPRRSALPSTLPDLVLVLGLAIAALLALTLWLARQTFEQASAVGMTRMQRAIERATDGVWELDLQSRRVYRSEALLRYLGLDPTQINGSDTGWSSRVHPDDLPSIDAALAAHLDGRADAFECTYRLRAQDGHWHTIVDRGRVIERTLDGRPWRLLGISADTTERGRADRARTESERRFRAMFETAYQLQLLLDLDGRILEANRAASDLAGTGHDPLPGQLFVALPWWPDDGTTRERVQERVERARSGETSRFEVTLHDATDRPVIVDVSLKPILDDHGQAVQVLAEGRDITERKRAETSLREIGALTTMGQLAARVAHEINNPLAGIQNAFLLVREAIPAAHPHYRFVGAIEREIARIAAVTRQLYETYRPDQAMETSSSVILAISDAVTFLEQVNRARQVRIETDVARAPSRVPVPDALLRQALYNLVQNALDASPSGGTITVAAHHDAAWCIIRVTDEGPGIPEALRHRIFDPFFSTKDRSVKTGGMGIGLSLVRQSVMAVGGEIDVRDRPSGGTEFEIRLPMIPIDTGVLR